MKNRILSLLLLFCTAFSTIAFAAPPPSYNKVKRVTCLAGYSGCSSVPVTLTLISTSGASVSRVIDYPDAGESYLTAYTRIQVTIGTTSSTDTYYLPTAVGETVLISGVDYGGVSYNVYVKKTAEKEFQLSAFESNF
ncbi:MAG: hypothetical protein JNL13_04630 [Chitinophagaceae bacterium]|nr:hypothetical protein [Chitinophagaceae bacterium]